MPLLVQHGRETRGPAVVAASDGAVVDLDGHGCSLPGSAAGAARRSREGEPGRAACRRRRPAPRARRAERVGHLGRAVPEQQRALERDREPLEQTAGALSSGSAARARAGDRRVEPRVRAGGEPHLREERVGASRARARGAQDVERVDVSRALPDRVQRALAVQPRQLRLLDVAVAAEALERLGDERRRALADPVLRDRGREPAERAVAPRRRRAPAAARSRSPPRDSRQRSASTFCISGCSTSSRPKAARCAAWCVASATARRISAVEPSTQSSRVWLTISRIVRTPRPSSPTSSATRAVERDLRRGVRAVAELVLEPLDPEARLRRASEEAREPGRRLREHEERVAHRRRAEPLVPVEHPGVTGRPRGRLVRAHVGAALPLGHRHPAERVAARQPRHPLLLRARARRGAPAPRRRSSRADNRRPASTWPSSMNNAARATCAPGRRPSTAATAGRLDPEVQQRVPGGWNSISSIRSP